MRNPSGKKAGNYQGGKIKKNCRHCNKEFSVFRYRKDTAKYCSQSCLAKNKIGKNAKNWQGGVDYENKRARATEEYEIWRKGVYKRDNWTCQECQKKCGNNIVAHHLLAFSKFIGLRFNIGNGITLCRACHLKVHTKLRLSN